MTEHDTAYGHLAGRAAGAGAAAPGGRLAQLQPPTLRRAAYHLIGTALLLVGLYAISVHNYLLFHSLAEIFAIVIGFAIFSLCWNCHRLLRDNFLVFLAIAYLFVAGLDTLHTLAYPGMGVFEAGGTNLAAQLWLGARYLEALSLLTMAAIVGRRVKPVLILAGFSLVGFWLLSAIFWWDVFPLCFTAADGLTRFKVVSEYAICGMLAGAAGLMILRRRSFDRTVLYLLLGSVGLTIASELAFTLYETPTGTANLAGHFLKILSFYLIYKAVVETGIVRPYSLLFRNLKTSERSLLRERARLQAVLEHMPAGLIIADAPSGKMVLTNDRVEEIWRGRFEPAEQISQYARYKTFHSDGRPYEAHQWPLARSLQKGEVVTEEEMDFLRQDGALGSMQVSSRPIRDEKGTVVAAVMVLRDVTRRNRVQEALRRAQSELEARVEERTMELLRANEALQGEIADRKEVEARLRDYQQKLRSLASRLARTEERERRRVAQELHDNIGQILATSKMKLGAAGALADSQELTAMLRTVAELLDDCIEFTRSMTFELGTPVLYEIGLEAALQNLAARMEREYGLSTSFEDDGRAKPLAEEARVALYRAARELLINVVKHARADSAKLSLRRQNGFVRLSVEDDGVGFDTIALEARNVRSQGFGLFSIRERISHLGGAFDLNSAPGEGTAVRLRVPLAEGDSAGRKTE